MAVSEIKANEVISQSRQALGLKGMQGPDLDDQLLASLVRRSAGINCPCSRMTLRASLLECLQYLTKNYDALPDRIDAVIEALIVGGDLLELGDVTTEDTTVTGTWVFAAPPSFVVRPSGSAFIFGVVPDQDAFLPQSLATRIAYDGFARLIIPNKNEELAFELREQGLQQLSENAWLKSPRQTSAADLVDRIERRLETQPLAGFVKDLVVLDPARPVTYYRGRWVDPKDHDGTFVARRPQEFGAPLWCFVILKNGVASRILDLPFEPTRWRASDIAWHLQMAMDCCRNNPQRYRRRVEGNAIRFDFFSPLPQWSQRRLMIFGRVAPREKSLMSYHLPVSEAQTEERFLEEMLWLSRTEDSE